MLNQFCRNYIYCVGSPVQKKIECGVDLTKRKLCVKRNGRRCVENGDLAHAQRGRIRTGPCQWPSRCHKTRQATIKIHIQVVGILIVRRKDARRILFRNFPEAHRQRLLGRHMPGSVARAGPLEGCRNLSALANGGNVLTTRTIRVRRWRKLVRSYTPLPSRRACEE